MWFRMGVVACGVVAGLAFASAGALAQEVPEVAKPTRVNVATDHTLDSDRYTRWLAPSRPIAGSVDDVSRRASGALESLQFGVVSAAGSTAIRTASRPVASPEFCDCKAANGRAVDGLAALVLLVSVEASADGECQVLIESDCSATVAFTGEDAACASVGLVELDFWDALAATQLPAPTTP